VNPVHWVDTVESTNTVLRHGSVSHGDAVATLNQTGGRGRLGRDWIESPGRGLALSVVLTEPVAVPTLVPLIAGATAVEVLRQLHPASRAWMKWPNDVYVGERKVAGILTEVPDASRMVVGIGVNLTHTAEELPLERATSLAIEGLGVDPVAFANEWRALLLARVESTDAVSTVDWLNSVMGMRGEAVRIDFPDGIQRTGTVVGIAGDGALMLDSGDRVVAGDITRLRPAD
jgi:BirA family biotin operon repressor/biotin-[acetyl-CoA-carboxylase] ligase